MNSREENIAFARTGGQPRKGFKFSECMLDMKNGAHLSFAEYHKIISKTEVDYFVYTTSPMKGEVREKGFLLEKTSQYFHYNDK